MHLSIKKIYLALICGTFKWSFCCLRLRTHISQIVTTLNTLHLSFYAHMHLCIAFRVISANRKNANIYRAMMASQPILAYAGCLVAP